MSARSFGFRPAVTGEVAGSLQLAVARQGRVTRPIKTESRGVMRLMRPLYLDDSGQVTYFIINPGGAYFGEKYEINVDVGPHANLLLSGQGATRIYKTPRQPAVQEMTMTLAPKSRLEYLPDQVIAYRDARYRQDTKVSMVPDAQCFIAEIVTPGWDPGDDKFTYAGMHLRTEVYAHRGAAVDIDNDQAAGAGAFGLVCIDNVRIEPGTIGKALHGIGYMEGATHMGSILIFGAHTRGDYIEAVRDIVDEWGPARTGVTGGERHGVPWVMVRSLGTSTDELYRMILAVNEYDRAVTTGQSRADLRRY